jgi:hypothetical protein
VAKRDGGLLEVEQDSAGALGGEALIGHGGQNLGDGDLHVVEGLHAGEAGAEDVGAAEYSGGILASLLITMMVEAELLAMESGRAARGAVRLGEVADANGHGCLQNGN